jgi:hypothetical protein
MKRLTITTLAALGILVGNMPLARAADTSCTTTISTGGTINGNLVVPAGANCTLNNVTVTGNVEVGKGARLSVEPVLGQRVTIGGNVQAARCNAVNLDSLGVSGSGGLISVGGNVQIEELYRLERLSGQRRPRHAIGGNLACAVANTSPPSRRARARARVEADNQRPWPADKVERWSIDRLIPYARNARTHTDAQVAAIAASIKEWGWTSPALVGEDGGLIAGHARVLAARQLGIAEIPVMVAAGWSEAQKRAYVLADNQLAITGSGWDPELLRLELGELKLGGFDLSLTGFGDLELKDLLAERTGGLTDPDDAPAAPEHPVSQTGDLWLLGAKDPIREKCTDPHGCAGRGDRGEGAGRARRCWASQPLDRPPLDLVGWPRPLISTLSAGHGL